MNDIAIDDCIGCSTAPTLANLTFLGKLATYITVRESSTLVDVGNLMPFGQHRILLTLGFFYESIVKGYGFSWTTKYDYGSNRPKLIELNRMRMRGLPRQGQRCSNTPRNRTSLPCGGFLAIELAGFICLVANNATECDRLLAPTKTAEIPP